MARRASLCICLGIVATALLFAALAWFLTPQARGQERTSRSVWINGFIARRATVIAAFPAGAGPLGEEGTYSLQDTAAAVANTGSYYGDDLDPGLYDIWVNGRLDSSWANQWLPPSAVASAETLRQQIDSSWVSTGGLSIWNLASYWHGSGTVLADGDTCLVLVPVAATDQVIVSPTSASSGFLYVDSKQPWGFRVHSSGNESAPVTFDWAVLPELEGMGGSEEWPETE